MNEASCEPNALSAWSRVLAREGGAQRAFGALLLTLAAHAALVFVAAHAKAPVPAIVDVTEVELLAAPTKPPEPTPAPPPEPAPSAPAPAAAPAAAKPRVARPSAPAAAAPLRTIDESVPTSDAPVRFVTDPNGTAFGFGSVARGGSAPSAPVGALPAAAESPRPSVVASAPVLSRPPRLAESDPCRGFFPESATADRGEVSLHVRVERDGAVRSIRVLSELPAGQGFGFAARDCLRSKRFSPALDAAGQEVAVVSPITVRFSR